MKINIGDTRVYPVACQSAFCGTADCTGCQNKPELDAFKAWVAAGDAHCESPTWAPTVYTARRST